MATTSDAVAHNRCYYTNCSPSYDVGRTSIFSHDRRRMEKDIEFMISRIGKDRQAIRVADVGCGTGHATSCFAESGVGHITAADFIEDFTSQVQTKLGSFEQLELRTVCCDAETFVGREERYDIVCFSSSIHFCPNHMDLVIQAADGCLKPGGFLYLTNSPMEQSAIARLWEKLHSALDYKLYKIMSGYKTATTQGRSVTHPISPQHIVETLRDRGFDANFEGYRVFHTSLFNRIALFTRPRGMFSVLIQNCLQN